MNEQILTTVEAALRRADVLRPGATLLVAVSGGADSVALLRSVCALGARHGFLTRAAHVEHGLRGEASVGDALFCERLCAELGVPFALDHAGLDGGMDAPGAEARARQARYALLLARAKACHADALLLAHHLDDQAETVLSHLIRGSGARGLGGMREQTKLEGVLLLRPLLRVPRQALLDALDDLPYRTDETNASPCCQRNRLRAEIMPLLTAENPRAAAHIAQSADLLAMDEACLQTQADTLLHAVLRDAPPFLCVLKGTLAAAPDAVAVRALRCFAGCGMARLAAEPDACPAGDERSLSAGDSLALLALLRAPEGTVLNLPRGLRALATHRFVHLVRMADSSPLAPRPAPPPEALSDAPRPIRFGALTFRFSAFDPAASPPPDGVLSAAVPTRLLPRLTLRVPRPGDHIRPFGAGGGKSLRRYLTDHKLDLPFRPFLPLLCNGAEVLWAVGLGAAEGTRVTNEPATLVTVEGEPLWAIPSPARPSPSTPT